MRGSRHEEGKIRKSLGDDSGTHAIAGFLLNWCRAGRPAERAQSLRANTGRSCSPLGQGEGRETRQYPYDSGWDEWTGSEATTGDWEYRNRKAH